MAEVSHNDTFTDRRPGEGRAADLPGGEAAPPALPQDASAANNPTLNRSAEAVGRGVGTAVASVRRLPQQLDRLRSRIHLVQSGPAEEAAQEANADVAGGWRDAVEVGVTEAAETAEKYGHAAAEGIRRGLTGLGRTARIRLGLARVQARRRLAEMRRWKSERPLRVIGVCAGAALVLGIGLRVWRSNRDEWI